MILLVLPKCNKNSFKLLKLKNDIELLIIQNPKASDKDGISVVLNTGAKYDRDILGLAHFTEHMLFLGSKSEKKETLFFDTISTKNGKFNGFTALESTAFFFNISSNAFEEAINIFSKFFINPPFDKTYVDKEINSVNSEYERNMQDDTRRREELFRKLSNKNSILYNFRTGNLETLKKYTDSNSIDLRERVLHYYITYFNPSNMRLIMYGSKSFEEYENLANKYFSEIIPKNPSQFGINIDTYNQSKSIYDSINAKYEKPFEFHNIGKLVFMQTVSNHLEFEITFMLPDVYSELPKNYGLFIKSLINFQGNDSLYFHLTQQGLITGIKSHIVSLYSGLGGFRIEGYLTEKGILNLNTLIYTIINYLDFLKDIVKDNTIYDFLKEKNNIEFNKVNSIPKSMIKLLKELSQNLNAYKLENLFTKNKLLSDYNLNEINSFLSYLTFDNSIIIIGDKDYSKQKYSYLSGISKDFTYSTETYNKEEIYLKTKYISFSLLTENLKVKNNYRFDTLQKSDLKQKKKHKKINRKSFKKDLSNLKPKSLYIKNNLEVFWKQDRANKNNKVNLYIKIDFNDNDKKLELIVISLIPYLFNFELTKSSNAKKINITLSQDSNIVELNIEAKSRNFSISTEIINILRNGKINNNNELDQIKSIVKKQNDELATEEPKLKAQLNFTNLLLKKYLSGDETIKTIDCLTIDKINEVLEKLWKNNKITILLHGNINHKKSLSFVNSINMLQNDYKSFHKSRNDFLNFNGNFIFRESVEKATNVNHATANYYYFGSKTEKNQAMLKILRMLFGTLFFSNLRIKKQLGYSTKVNEVELGNKIYFMVFLQGSKELPTKIDKEIDSLIKKQLKNNKISRLSSKTFKRYKQIIIKKYSTIKKKFVLRSRFIWKQLKQNTNKYNLIKHIQRSIKSITKLDIISKFKKMIKLNNKISIQEFSNKINIHDDNLKLDYQNNQNIIFDIEYFRNKNKHLR